jgi:hypothetical protein
MPLLQDYRTMEVKSISLNCAKTLIVSNEGGLEKGFPL